MSQAEKKSNGYGLRVMNKQRKRFEPKEPLLRRRKVEEEYYEQEVSVDDFGKFALSKMGFDDSEEWNTEPKKVKLRQARLGLGAEPFIPKEVRTKQAKNLVHEKSAKEKGFHWSLPSLNVQILDPTSKYHMKKAVISDVIYEGGSPQCVLSMDGGILLTVEEKYLETKVPKVGEEILVLKGEDRGQVGTVLEIGSDEKKVMIQLREEPDVVDMYDIEHVCTFKEY